MSCEPRTQKPYACITSVALRVIFSGAFPAQFPPEFCNSAGGQYVRTGGELTNAYPTGVSVHTSKEHREIRTASNHYRVSGPVRVYLSALNKCEHTVIPSGKLQMHQASSFIVLQWWQIRHCYAKQCSQRTIVLLTVIAAFTANQFFRSGFDCIQFCYVLLCGFQLNTQLPYR